MKSLKDLLYPVRVLCAATMILVASTVKAEVPYGVQWSRQIGATEQDFSTSVAIDISGNAYISGYTAGSLGGPQSGSGDAFLSKYSGAGNLLWSRQIGTADEDYSRAVAVDASGNAYISGLTWGSLGGPNAGYYDAFLAKYDSLGTFEWSRQVGSANYDQSNSVAVDASGNVYISGQAGGSLGGPHVGSWDTFLIKYDGSGNLLWSRQLGTTTQDFSYSVAVDVEGSAYISGDTLGSLGGPKVGSYDAFLSKYNDTGSILWSRQIGSARSDTSYSVAVDSVGNAYITGETSGSLGGTIAGPYDAFLVKYDRSGDLQWSRQIGTASEDKSYSVAVDAAGSSYISGSTWGNLDGPNAGYNDAFLTKYDSAGNPLWSRQIGTTGTESGASVAIDAFGNAYISGGTDGSLGGPFAGYRDAFLIKFSPVVPEPSSILLFATAGISLLRRRRRGRRSRASNKRTTQ